jgi:hypothetical protein
MFLYTKWHAASCFNHLLENQARYLLSIIYNHLEKLVVGFLNQADSVQNIIEIREIVVGI